MNEFDYPTDLQITKITHVRVIGTSPKMIGRNSQRDIHGETSHEQLIRVFTNHGYEGFGVTAKRIEELEKTDIPRVLGRNPCDLFDPERGITVKGLEHALWDLIGKVTGQPVYELLGGSHRETVEAYDGTLYFCDILYPDRGLQRIEEEAAESVAKGHRAIKMKVGRGKKWMEKEEGFRRDVEAVKAVRRIVGDDVKLLIDANNGYDCDGAMQLMGEIGHLNIYWAEEMFPETLEDYHTFTTFIREHGWKTLVTDGEGLGSAEPFVPYFEAGVLDAAQPNINRTGLTEYKVLSALAAKHRAYCAPHSWGSQFGLFVSLHLGKAIPNFLSAEVTAYEFDVYIPAGLTFHEGTYTVSDMPGFGVILNERVYNERYKKDEVVYEL
jgi:L-alanine-DL-glutamate epimerase-like enolase superfamily enzyme